MAVNIDDFLVYAEQLANTNNGSELELRSSTEHAYYAAFFQAKKYVRECSVKVPQWSEGGSHEQIIDLFKRHKLPEFVDIGNLLSTMKHNRVQARYVLRQTWIKRVTSQNLLYAKTVFDKLKALDDPLTKQDFDNQQYQ